MDSSSKYKNILSSLMEILDFYISANEH